MSLSLQFEDVFVSTGTFSKSVSLEDRIKTIASLGVKNIELSGGNFEKDWRVTLRKFPGIKFSIHNYFPPPRVSFSLNLASPKADIRLRSLELAKTAIKAAAELGDNVYSVHAGFCFDPDPESLGSKLVPLDKILEKSAATVIFEDSLNVLVAYAHQEGVRLLVENNVLTASNALIHGQDSLLLLHYEEISRFLKGFSGSLGFLLDMGHLKVSSKTLGYDFEKQFSELVSVAEAMHIHDNDGVSDSHFGLVEVEQQLSRLGSKVRRMTLEVVPDQLELTLKKLGH